MYIDFDVVVTELLDCYHVMNVSQFFATWKFLWNLGFCKLNHFAEALSHNPCMINLNDFGGWSLNVDDKHVETEKWSELSEVISML